MKKIFIFLLLLKFLNVPAQKIRVELSESYELGNILLALTKYGKTDPWDVQKIAPYYDDLQKYFEPMKNHPLLDSINYSRLKWEKFLGFRTDMYAFGFDKDGILKRQYPFNSFGPIEVDKNIDLINDFIVKSKYREFYKRHIEFYKLLKANYLKYYFINKAKKYLDEITSTDKNKTMSEYVIAISPLVGGQNCHREIDSTLTVDFPSLSSDLASGNIRSDLKTRISETHTIFTELDHGYVNPISEKYKKIIEKNFAIEKWNVESGYEGIDVFNEYMTWAVYDLFIKENFPKVADSISLQWHYQNASRGFIAQNIFSNKVSELFFKQKGHKSIDGMYNELLKWCNEYELKVTQPEIINIDKKRFVKTDITNISIEFSEEMNSKLPFSIKIYEFKNGNQTGREKSIEIKNAKWSKNFKVITFGIDTEFNELAMIFNWWGIGKPLLSKKQILLKPNSYLLLRK